MLVFMDMQEKDFTYMVPNVHLPINVAGIIQVSKAHERWREP